MSRPAEIEGKPATERVTFRVNPDMLRYLDTASKTHGSRGKYLRALVRDDATRKAGR